MHLPTSLVCAVLTLLASPTAADSLASNNASLLWGPYRPNLYLGIRPRVPESLLMGLMWGKLDEGERNLRHACEQNEMAGYGWSSYDSRTGGTQTIQDPGNRLTLTTEFIKKHEGQSAGNWALRVRGAPQDNTKAGLKTLVVFYVAMEAMPKCPECRLEAVVEEQGTGDDVSIETVDIQVKHPKLGISSIHIPNPKSPGNERMNRTDVHENTAVKSVKTTEEMLWRSKSCFLNISNDNTPGEMGNLLLPNEPGVGNMHFVQMLFQDNFEFDILYSTQKATRPMTSLELTGELEDTVDSFKSRFSSVFRPSPPFESDSHTAFGQSLLSNLLGGLGYFYGDTQVDESHAPEYEETGPLFWKKAAAARSRAKAETKGPYELLTHVPSRPFFPRGFLWDEGFHLLPVLDWDIDLALEVIRSWLALMDDDGWIAREQVLGPEARSKVPADFQIQYPHIATPPTLFWVVSKYIDMLSGMSKYSGHESIYMTQPDEGKALLTELYPLLKRHYEWFRKTQSGDVEAHAIPHASLGEGYRWRGRTPEYNMASGLDDFPRAEPPDPTELHIDALCWVGVMAETLQKIVQFTENSADVVTYQDQYSAIAQNIEAVHWSEKYRVYCDARVWDDTHIFTCPKGYVSLFPFITGFLGPNHTHLDATLDLIRDPEHLWTDYGIRSLSPESTRYGTEGDYWRSPIWINFNYLIIERLLELATTPGPFQERCREIYRELRRNVGETVYKSWLETGFAWEQYSADGGYGQRTQHFTGWTALVVKIMAFPDLDYGNSAGVKETIGGLIKESQRWSARSVVIGMMLLMFIFVTRRRFASLLRDMRGL